MKEDTRILRIEAKNISSETHKVSQIVTTILPKIAEISEYSTLVRSNLQSLADDTKEVHEHVKSIEQDVSRVNIGQASGFGAIHEQLRRIETVQTTLVALATTRGSLFLKTSDPAATTLGHDGRGMYTPVDSSVGGPQKLGQRLCFCRKRTHFYMTSYAIGWFRVLSRSENVIVHSKSCPFWNPKLKTRATELAVECIRSVFGRMIKMAIKVTRGAGGLSISPLLTIRGFVPHDSPVFALFDMWTLEKHRDDIGSYLDYTCTRMLQHFGDGDGSPYDVSQRGSTLLHVSN